jgi:hypothetical protein
MRLLDHGMRAFVLNQGTAFRWFREELNTLRVTTPLCDGCIGELVRAADDAAWRMHLDAAQRDRSYLALLREELARRANWAHAWTRTDDAMPEDESGQAFVRIARKFALPRPWRLSEPVAVAACRPPPTYWNWASALEGVPLRHV